MKRFLRSGEPCVWLSGGALALCLVLICGLVAVIMMHGLRTFWPADLVEIELAGGEVLLGQRMDRQEIPPLPGASTPRWRIRYKIGNRDVYGLDYRWIDADSITQRRTPAEAVIIERRQWGNLHGRLRAVRAGKRLLGRGDAARSALEDARSAARALDARVAELEHGDMASVQAAIEELRLAQRRQERTGGVSGTHASPETRLAALWRQYDGLSERIADLRRKRDLFQVEVDVPGGGSRTVAAGDVVRIVWPNRLGLVGKAEVYASRLWEFLSAESRESNTEGGIFPALFGTVMMVILMSLAVVPFGVLAALYLHEYAHQGTLVKTIRIAINNLAGVPSIVFGMFGLGFFVYGVGGALDLLLYADRLPTPTYGTGGILWASLTLALLTLPVVIVATEEALGSVPAGIREGSLALGSTQLQMIWRVVLPSALPGILTGVILATARGAGEVAPLMITGVVKLAPDLPLDANWPFLHLERKFMHLGFHIYDVGFQSPNIEAARPMVYATTLLLLVVVLLLNLTAIVVRQRLRRRYSTAEF